MTIPRRKLLAALFSSLLLSLASPGTPGYSLCMWVALVPLLAVAVSSSSPAQAAWLGLISGVGFYAVSLSWITIVLGAYGELNWFVSGAALLLLSLYMGIYTAIFAFGCRWADNRLPLPLFAPVLWVGLDHLRAVIFTGFPWLDLGYSQFQTNPLLQTADLFGHHTVTFLIVMVNGMLATIFLLAVDKDHSADATTRKRAVITAILPAVVLLAAALTYGANRLHQVAELCNQADTISVAVVQGNVPQEIKWSDEFRQNTIERYIDLSEQALADNKTADLTVWPETAFPEYPYESPYFLEIIDKLGSAGHGRLLLGAPHRQRSLNDGLVRYYNSAFLVTPAAVGADAAPGDFINGRYDKQHLVPFGEYIPFRSILPFFAPIVNTIGDFNPGLRTRPIPCGNAEIGVLICFESIFPELSRTHVVNGANILVNITNDAWFGRSNAPWQHLSMATFRAVENRRSLARAANTGISGCFDPLGHPTRLLTLFTTQQITVRLPLLTVETFFSRYGHNFGAFCLLALLPIAVWINRYKGILNN